MSVRSGRILLMTALVVVTACTSRTGDEEVPQAAGTGCPDLAGSYAPQATGTPGFDLVRQLSSPDGGGRYAALVIDTIGAGSPIHLRLVRTPEDMDERVAAFRTTDPEAWARWRAKAARGALSLGLSSRTFAEALAALGPSPERAVTLSEGLCDAGWLRFAKTERRVGAVEDETGREDQREQSLSFAVDASGHLLVREERTRRDEFSIWCGDGCQGIPYSTETVVRWARFPPTEAPPAWRFRDPLAEVLPAGMPAASRDTDPRTTALRRRVFEALPTGATMFNFHEDSDGIGFTGTCLTGDDLDRLIGFVRQQPEVAEVTLGRNYDNNRGHREFRLAIVLTPR